MKASQQREQEDRGGQSASLFDSVAFIILLFGLPVPFVFLVTALHQFAMMSYPLYVVFGAYGLLVTSFVEAATRVIRWTSNAIVSKHDSEGTLMTPLVFVLFPQWILFLYTILNSLDCDASANGEADIATIALSAMMTIGIPLMILLRAFRQAWKDIDEEDQRQKMNRKTAEPARNIIALSRNVHSKRFNGVTSCLKLL